ncbi:unnamed protein product [Ectocarpus sp. 12 AP-2014]
MSSGYGDNRLLGLDPFGRYTKEMSVTAGMLCLFGFINLVPGVYDLCLSTIDGQDWSGDSDVFPPVVRHLAALIQITFSIVSMAVGFQYLVCGGACSHWTMISLFCSSFSLFTFAVSVAYTGFLSAKESFDFIPFEYGASTSENRSVASMIAIAYVAYAINNFFALVHLNYKMFMYQSDQWVGFNRGFYKMALMFVGLLTLLAGTVQLALGAYVFDKVDEDRLSSPLGAIFLSGPLLVTYSRLAMAFGAFQLVLGCYIMFRATQASPRQKPSSGSGENAKGLQAFQFAAWFVLVLSICIQVLSQVTMSSTSTNNVNGHAGFAAQAVAYVVGLGLFPMYLDAMYYTTPETIDQNDFCGDVSAWSKGKGDIEERKVESASVEAQAVAAPNA